MEKAKIKKSCQYCGHAMHCGLHCVAIKCDVDGRMMFGYSAENEYRENAKDCQCFDPKCKSAWSPELMKNVDAAGIEWI